MKTVSRIFEKADIAVILLAFFNVVFHIIFCNNLEYHRDELLYFSLGLHPDIGYATVPPLIGWISLVMQSLFGYSIFAVRLFPALLSGGMILIAGAISKEMGGTRYASFLAGLGLTVCIFFMRSFSLFHPVHIEIFLWTICIFFLIKFINTQTDKFLIFFGIFAGISLLNKYLAILLFAGLIVIVPFTEHRVVFRKRMFWIGILTGFIIILPNLVWQAINGFPVIHHMSELYNTQLVHMDVPTFLIEQLVSPFAGTIFTIAGLIFLLTSKDMRKFRFLGFLALFIIAGLLILKGKSYYTLGIFPLLIISGAVALERWLKKTWMKILFPVLIVIVTVPVVPIGLPVLGLEGLKEYFRTLDQKYGIDLGRRFEDGSIHSLPQDYADMLGWEELTALANKAWQKIPDKKTAFVYAENYGQAGAITIIGKKYGLPEAVSFHESFLYWFPEKFDPDITSLVYINDEPGEDILQLFRKITRIGSISNPDAREYGTSVYLCEDPIRSFNEFWEERLSMPDISRRD